jgi:predicted nucleotidyltransferase
MQERDRTRRNPPAMLTSRDEVLKLIEQNQATLRRLGVRRLGLFGSYARGEAMPGSDLDFVVELSEKSFDVYMDTKLFLEDLFQSRVDLVTMSSIKPRLLQIIQREAVYAPGF